MVSKLILCDCEGSQSIDADRIEKACGVECSKVHTALCTRELSLAAELFQPGEQVVVACGQEHETFKGLAEELGVD